MRLWDSILRKPLFSGIPDAPIGKRTFEAVRPTIKNPSKMKGERGLCARFQPLWDASGLLDMRLQGEHLLRSTINGTPPVDSPRVQT